jgi:hypothetical protein
MTTAAHRRAIDLARDLPLPFENAVAILETSPGRVIGSDLRAPWTDTEGDTSMAVELLGGRRIVREAHVGIGRLMDDDDARALPLWWQDAEHPQLFPTFDGGLELRGTGDATELRLVGSYRAPLGLVGRFADGLLGHRVVMASLETFLDGVARRLVAALPSGPTD